MELLTALGCGLQNSLVQQRPSWNFNPATKTNMIKIIWTNWVTEMPNQFVLFLCSCNFTTFSDECLGLHYDEERSELRFVRWIAKPSESLNFWTHTALAGVSWKHVSLSVGKQTSALTKTSCWHINQAFGCYLRYSSAGITCSSEKHLLL